MRWSPVKAQETAPSPVPRADVERQPVAVQRPLRLQARLGQIVGHVSPVGASAAFRRRAGREMELAEPVAPKQNAAHEYHTLTKHRFPDRYAAGPGQLEWEDQPDPNRRFAGAPELQLPSRSGGRTHWGRRSSGMALRDGASSIPAAFIAAEQVEFSNLFSLDGRIAPQPLTPDSISSFLFHSMATSASTVGGDDSYNLRVVASSGNLHSVETYLLLPVGTLANDEEGAAADDVGANLYHYVAERHRLAQRAAFPMDSTSQELFASGSFLVALSSVVWRQAWKYGDRGWRYSELDCGHAVGALRMAAQMHGWVARVVSGVGDATLSTVLGLNRAEDFPSLHEDELSVVLLAIGPTPLQNETAADAVHALARATAVWQGVASPLGDSDAHHEFDNSAVIASAVMSTQLSVDAAANQQPPSTPLVLKRAVDDGAATGGLGLTAASVIRTRRSIWRMVPQASEMSFSSLTRILTRCARLCLLTFCSALLIVPYC